ncbi:polyphenol oxidase family protein [Micropruina sp.]|uniref:polyphenol oxidase family protein n=1 Tax=Micropruina sp. TaxID=2737536 RepID=UPI00261B539B|nr:polyphenol oxidase family protein [Micropruina sp.]
MYDFYRDPGADGVGVAFSDAVATDGGVLSLGGAHGATGRAPGLAVLEADLGVPLAVVSQVHGTDVAVVGADTDLAVLATRSADALLTTRPGIGLAVRVADCVPVLFADAAGGVIAAAHAGRVGLADGVLQTTVAAMRDAGAEAITAWIGPHICGRCYEVPEAMATEVEQRVPGSRGTTDRGTPGLDLGAGALGVLTGLGVRVHEVGRCTLQTPTLHSYRRDAAASGRQAGIIWLTGGTPS